MGIKIAVWQQDIINKFEEGGISVSPFLSGSFLLLRFEGYKQLLVNLISVDQTVSAEDLLRLQQNYAADNIQLIQLWEDIWLTRPAQILSRISSLTGQNITRIHGRKTKVVSITQPEADVFLQENHLQGSAKSRYKYALVVEGEVVAVATFSAKRRMTRINETHTSIELIRFATAVGITVQGGLSKLIKHLVNTVKPDDVMTYADLDWSSGKGYTKLGFELAEQTPPDLIWLHQPTLLRYFPHRIAETEVQATGLTAEELTAYLLSHHYVRIFNTGNLKYILYL